MLPRPRPHQRPTAGASCARASCSAAISASRAPTAARRRRRPALTSRGPRRPTRRHVADASAHPATAARRSSLRPGQRGRLGRLGRGRGVREPGRWRRRRRRPSDAQSISGRRHARPPQRAIALPCRLQPLDQRVAGAATNSSGLTAKSSSTSALALLSSLAARTLRRPLRTPRRGGGPAALHDERQPRHSLMSSNGSPAHAMTSAYVPRPRGAQLMRRRRRRRRTDRRGRMLSAGDSPHSVTMKTHSWALSPWWLPGVPASVPMAMRTPSSWARRIGREVDLVELDHPPAQVLGHRREDGVSRTSSSPAQIVGTTNVPARRCAAARHRRRTCSARCCPRRLPRR